MTILMLDFKLTLLKISLRLYIPQWYNLSLTNISRIYQKEVCPYSRIYLTIWESLLKKWKCKVKPKGDAFYVLKLLPVTGSYPWLSHLFTERRTNISYCCMYQCLNKRTVSTTVVNWSKEIVGKVKSWWHISISLHLTFKSISLYFPLTNL